jgi:DNA-binding NtrC family response regulator
MRQLHGLAGRRILLVEDESRLREMLLQGTRVMGFEATAVPSAEQALRALEQKPFPVIVVDLNLPGAGGLQLIQTVRQRWPHVQAIILTGFGDLQAARDAIRLEVVDFLTKPCALGDLEVAIGRAFRRLQQNQPSALDPVLSEAEEHEGDLEPANVMDAPAREKPGSSRAFAPRDGNDALLMEDVERRAILAALEKHNGNRAATAAELGISLRKLYYRLGEYQKKGLIS